MQAKETSDRNSSPNFIRLFTELEIEYLLPGILPLLHPSAQLSVQHSAAVLARLDQLPAQLAQLLLEQLFSLQQ